LWVLLVNNNEIEQFSCLMVLLPLYSVIGQTSVLKFYKHLLLEVLTSLRDNQVLFYSYAKDPQMAAG
jgi:hypothetical protein